MLYLERSGYRSLILQNVIRGIMQLLAYGAHDIKLYPEEYQPSGTANFSRLNNNYLHWDTSRFLWEEKIKKTNKELLLRFSDKAIHKEKLRMVNQQLRLLPDIGIDFQILVQKYQNHLCFS